MNRQRDRLIVLLTVTASLLIAACTNDANIPGVTRDPEASALAAYPEIPKAEDAAELIETGRKIFQSRTCGQCHSINVERQGLAGPPLGGYLDRILGQHDHDPLEARRWTLKHIKEPAKYPGEYAGSDEYRGMLMTPNPRIPDDDLRALVEYVLSLR